VPVLTVNLADCEVSDSTHSFKLSEIKSDYLVLDVWYSACGVCMKQMPDVQALHDAYKDNEKIEVVSAIKKDNSLSIVGALTVNGLFVGDDGVMFTRKSEVPFETSIPCEAEGEISLSAAIKSATVKLITFTETECDAEAVFTVYVKDAFAVEVISEIEEGEPKIVPDAAVSVYIPLAGEGLWELSKRLNVCPESLVSTNPDLQFPLTGKERIVVYRQK
ncbi:MAG: redoxin domain-containing protein, partial [Clostridia bacterium]|nr:redoxin domain-containing protein [Clostridia bacterium]